MCSAGKCESAEVEWWKQQHLILHLSEQPDQTEMRNKPSVLGSAEIQDQWTVKQHGQEGKGQWMVEGMKQQQGGR